MNFDELREANNTRYKEWCTDTKVEDVPISFAAVELGGEVGELLNEVKKLERERMGLKGGKTSLEDLRDEMGDVVICVDLLARKFDIDLSEAVRRKFNKTSNKHGFETKL